MLRDSRFLLMSKLGRRITGVHAAAPKTRCVLERNRIPINRRYLKCFLYSKFDFDVSAAILRWQSSGDIL